MGSTGLAAQAAGRGDGAALRQILLQGLLLAMGLALLLGRQRQLVEVFRRGR